MPYSVLLASTDDEQLALIDELKTELETHYPKIKVWLVGEPQADEAEVAACWYPDPELLTQYPNIKVVQSIAAGFDHLGEKILSAGLPICRVIDEEQKRAMFEYILWGVLNVHRKFDVARRNQSNKNWCRYTQRSAKDVRIGLLGLGALGAYVAEQLSAFGYSVLGWSRSQKDLLGVDCYSGTEGLDKLLAQSEIIVNLLPLNSATSGILSSSLFDKMQMGSYLINCGRGGHLNCEDLVSAVNIGRLRGALLDVFVEEPLPDSDRLWTTEGVTITPHVASDASVATLAKHVAANTLKHYHSEPLNNQVDLSTLD